jgi:hypothetical protein
MAFKLAHMVTMRILKKTSQRNRYSEQCCCDGEKQAPLMDLRRFQGFSRLQVKP